MHDDGKDVDREIDLREKRRPRGAIVELMRGDVGLLKLNERRGDRVQQHEGADAEQVGRAKNVRDAGDDPAADRLFWLGITRQRGLLLRATPD